MKIRERKKHPLPKIRKRTVIIHQSISQKPIIKLGDLPRPVIIDARNKIFSDFPNPIVDEYINSLNDQGLLKGAEDEEPDLELAVPQVYLPDKKF